MLKKFPSDTINSTKDALFFLFRAPTSHNFTFNLQFLYELRRKVRFSKTVCGIFHFRFRFIFIKVYRKFNKLRNSSSNTEFNKMHGPFDFKTS